MQGEKECPFYLRTGCCKYSANCRFHHPEPVSIPANYLTARFEKDGYRQGLASGKSKSPKASFPLQRASVELSSSLDASSPSYIPRILLPHQVFHTSKLSIEYGEYQVIFFLKYFSCATITIFCPCSIIFTSRHGFNIQLRPNFSIELLGDGSDQGLGLA